VPRYVVISTNDKPAYSWYVPIVQWAWKQFGWETICLRPFILNGYREETITQCVRLYAANMFNGDPSTILMTSDADMIPMSDYWNPNENKITVYGHDLTGYQHTPICYIAMSANKWRDVMHLTGEMYADMKIDLANSKAKSSVKNEWWQVDQDIITERLSHHEYVRVDRGIEPGGHLPLGRMDRYGMKYPAGPMIDFHAPHNPTECRDKINEVLMTGFGIKYQRSEIYNYVNGIQ